MKIRAVIFDLDGTITQPYFDFDAIREEIGLDRSAGPLLELMERMSAEERARAEEILGRHEERAVTESTLNPGARETLEALRRRGIHLAVLTRNRRDNALAVAHKHGLRFERVLGREDGPVKPDAFGVLEICRDLGVAVSETLMVGDYLFDLLCAKAAGAISVLLVNQENAASFAEHADFTIANIPQILQIIDGGVAATGGNEQKE